MTTEKTYMNTGASRHKKVVTMTSVMREGERTCKLKQEKRHKFQLFYTIICAIEEEIIINGSARPTRIQHQSRLSYDRMINHFTELEEKRMIQRTPNGSVSITNKAKEFIKRYDELMNLIEGSNP
ncbi:MAG TPA: winged helix-turn-helix domain-containing protein [Nitrososphaeraceae archaeon]|nr:winged helix-turn-helix domain-containing protein [Nitrososphaeraceae archaeon]